ncbi:uncharacterized protein LOC114527753 [Dendronephthya gigantea]|uniref:uncharacterized protein LOC114527753 n=1 Tax=Dendronephthya gigantea TaxID=151771 RepID=UPI00106CB856|nr:uncharacterized protein LOC114527753 [Dendronephthya gigantea]
MVLTDQYSRYPEVEFICSTAITPVRKALKKIFQTGHGPPFDSYNFTQLAAELGFKHKRITPYHPKAQGQVENFNKLINKIAAFTKDTQSTPHPATKTAPYELLMNRRVRTKLEHFSVETPSKDNDVRHKDKVYKEKAKKNHDKRYRVTTYQLKVGDAVIVKGEKKKKGGTPFEPHIYSVTGFKDQQ